MKVRVEEAEVSFACVLEGIERATRISRTDARVHEFCLYDAERLEAYAKRIRIFVATKGKPVRTA